jgi:hypothetical protein
MCIHTKSVSSFEKASACIYSCAAEHQLSQRCDLRASPFSPVSGLHTILLHGLACKLHTTGVPLHCPARHTLPVVHSEPSVQLVPSGVCTSTQPSVALSHTDCTHCRKSRVRRVQVTELPVYKPALHLQQQQQQRFVSSGVFAGHVRWRKTA